MAPEEKNAKPNARRGALQVYDALREDILWVRIKPGSALDEVGLAERFKVSRTPIREALLLLSGESIVQFLPNRTTIVAPLLLNNLGDYLDTFLILSRGAARSAALCGLADPEKLSGYLDRYRAAIADGRFEDALRADNSFRRYLAGLSGNIFQIRYFDQVLDAGVRTKVLYYFPGATKAELEASADMLGQLAMAVASGDADASDRYVTEAIHAEFEIVTRVVKPRFADTLDMSNHPVNPGALK
ncbi:MAG: GntR family transcriptional regulator [Rhizobiaceae bacterium]|jgi:DNA-binding GntR family transcriptional regulator|nr:GntR family transcriptional regulator [Rhizobiaceae bacterium]MBO6728008.1 GntR family transcriptional regulator [Rhizobiaceae bacterium]